MEKHALEWREFRLRLGDFRGSFDFAQDDTLGLREFLLQRETYDYGRF